MIPIKFSLLFALFFIVIVLESKKTYICMRLGQMATTPENVFSPPQ